MWYTEVVATDRHTVKYIGDARVPRRGPSPPRLPRVYASLDDSHRQRRPDLASRSLFPLRCSRKGAAAAAARTIGPEVTFPVTIPADDPKLAAMKKEAIRMIDSMSTFTQQMVDMVFSFGELGISGRSRRAQYLTGILEKNGFKVDARRRRNSHRVGRDVGLRQAGHLARLRHRRHPAGEPEARRRLQGPDHRGAPGHGEGHNSGVPMNITAAIAVKKIMERDNIPGTLQLWPGVAEELMAGKAYFVRAGVFKDVDVVLFTHVGERLAASRTASRQSDGADQRAVQLPGLERARRRRAVGAARSALDAVELMDVGWNFRREHLPLDAAVALRDHRRRRPAERRAADGERLVLLPRDRTTPKMQALFALGDTMARAAAMMTSTKLVGVDIARRRLVRTLHKVDRRRRCTRTSRRSGMPTWDAKPTRRWRKGIQRGARRRAVAGAVVAATMPADGELPPPTRPRGLPGRRLGRHRRRVVERADRDAALPGQHSRTAGPQLGERDLDGDADRAQGRDGGREGSGADDARPDAQADARHAGVGLLQERADEGDRSTTRSCGRTTSRPSG